MIHRLLNISLAVLASLSSGAYLLHADNGSSGSGKTETEFVGKIETLPPSGAAGKWLVGGRAVNVTAQTELRAEKGPIVVGALAEVKGTLESDNSVTASRIRIQDSPAPSTPTPSPVTPPAMQPQIEGLKGLVEAAPTTGLIGDWKVAGRVVRITAATKIEQNPGSLAVGALVEVKGTSVAGVIDATKVEVIAPATASPKPAVPAEVTGLIQSLPADIHNGDWIVGGNTVRVSASTRIDAEHGAPAVGATAEVHGTLGDAGVITATSIEVKAAPNTATPMTLSTILGVVRSRPTQNGEGEWRINGEIVHVHSSTTLDSSNGSIGVGAVVQVNGWQDSDKSIHAESVTARPQPPASNPEAQLARFTGRVTEDFGADLGKVDDRAVRTDSTTLIDSDPTALTSGVLVEVRGFLLDDGSFQATKVEIVPSAPSAAQPSLAETHVGEVESMSSSGGYWQVNGLSVRVTSSTRIRQSRGALGTGASIEIRGWRHPDGFVEATEIEVLSGKK